VVAVEPHGAHLVRVTFGGDGLRGFTWPGPGSHLKVFLPGPGQHNVDLPPADEDGFMLPPAAGQPRPVTRTFTPLAWDEDSRRLDIEFLLHGHGPASQWAAGAKEGDNLAVSQPRRRYDVLPDSRWLLLAGDESALPAITTILHDIEPALETGVIVEVEEPGREVDLPARPQVVVRSADQRPGAALLAAIADRELPAGPGQVWAACEARGVRDIRAYLLGTRGLPAARVLTRGYWRDGYENHPDHDYGDDELN
jgi:NADPH-dependent ferric siderophore reductase